MKSWKKQTLTAMAVGGVLFGTSLSHAGEVLRLRVGTVQPHDTTTMEKFMPANTSRSQAISRVNYVVQFKEAITQVDRNNLEALGARIINYIPDDAYLVAANADIARDLQMSDRINAVVPFMSTWKLSPNFENRSVFTAKKLEKVQIQVAEGVSTDRVATDLAALGSVEVEYAGDKVIVANMPLVDLERVAANDGVVWMQPHTPMKLMHMDLMADHEDGDEAEAEGEETQPKGDYTDLTGYESGTKIMKFDVAWEKGYTGEGQIVSMADTGLDSGAVDTLHGDFANVTSGYTFGLFAKSWKDPMGHGTHVAGSVMGNGQASGELLRGGAYNAKMIAEGMWSPLLNNLTVPPEVSELFAPAYKDGARIHTNSWGGARQFGAYDDYARQVDEFMWEHPDMLIVFAAGNSGIDADKDGRVDAGSMSSPGTAKNVLTVGASENMVLIGGIQKKLGELMNGEAWGVEPMASDLISNNENGIAAFSSRGPTNDGRIKPDVVAPGTNIISNCSQVDGSSPLWGNYNDDYCYSGGTSMSTPLTAGGVAVAREYLQKEWGMESPSAALMKGVMMHTAFDMFPGQYGEREQGQELLNSGPNSDQGYGRVDMASVVTSEYLALVDNTEGMSQDKPDELVLSEPVESLKVTLVYTDAPGSTNAAKALVNDLNLEVVTADGETVVSESDVNNHEQIMLKSVPEGEVKIRVVGKSIPEGKDGRQPYALIVTR